MHSRIYHHQAGVTYRQIECSASRAEDGQDSRGRETQPRDREELILFLSYSSVCRR